MMYKSMYDTLQKYVKQERYEHNNFYGSEVGTCHRKRVLSRINYPQLDTSDRLARVFKIGNLFENFVYSALKKQDRKVIRPKTLYLCGYAVIPDFIVNNGTKRIILEIKTVHSQKFHYLISDDKIDKHYALQTALQCMWFGIDEGRLIYLSKDDLCIREFQINPQIYKQQILKDIFKVRKYYRNKVLPKAEPVEEWECKRCWFFKNNTECQKLKTWEEAKNAMLKV